MSCFVGAVLYVGSVLGGFLRALPAPAPREHSHLLKKNSEMVVNSKLDPDCPESKQFHVSKGHVSGSVLGAAVAARCNCCGACARCRCLGACARFKCSGGLII